MSKDKKYCGTCTRFPGNKNNSALNAPAECPRKGKIVTATTEACKTGHRTVKI